MPSRKSTGKFMMQGQTASNLYGNDPNAKSPVTSVNNSPRDLKP